MRISDWSSDVCSSELGKTTAAVAAFTFDELMDLVHSIDPAYRAASTCRFMFNDSTLLSMRKMKDGAGNYMWHTADGRTGASEQVLGYVRKSGVQGQTVSVSVDPAGVRFIKTTKEQN